MSQNQITKGMILGAGLGTRLLPITERFPKPLVPVLNLANLLHTVALFRRNGIHEIVVNLFHLPERIEEFVKEFEHTHFHLAFSKESTLLGTGGGVKHAEAFFQRKPFVLANCDFISNLNIEALIQFHLANKSWATMALMQDAERQKLYSSVGVDEKFQICSLPKKRTHEPTRTGIFTGVHVLDPEIFSFLEDRPSGINEILYPALMEKHPERARGFFVDNAFWFDTGDMPALWQSSMRLLDLLSDKSSGLLSALCSYGPAYQECAPGIWITQKTQIPSTVKVTGPVMIGEGCSFESGVVVGPHAVIGNGVTLSKNCRVQNSVVLSSTTVPAEKRLSGIIFFEGREYRAQTLG
ncbi:MAG: NDP-sugar synthase [Proteobacteria bacterium]|nr:NDP-sugar synthase [Pseudomonadota bacterium]